jgi:hypothetical protein
MERSEGVDPTCYDPACGVRGPVVGLDVAADGGDTPARSYRGPGTEARGSCDGHTPQCDPMRGSCDGHTAQCDPIRASWYTTAPAPHATLTPQ